MVARVRGGQGGVREGGGGERRATVVWVRGVLRWCM